MPVATSRPRVLVTNDDGVHAPGLAALARHLVAAGHDVVVAAPLDDRSGTGAGFGTADYQAGIEVIAYDLEGLDGVPAYGVAGPPALAVMASRLGAFGPEPDLVASGINPGHNTGRSVLHSGTVGAALTAANFGISGLAVSAGTGLDPHFETAAAIAVTCLEWLAAAPAKTVLNVNVPSRPLDELAGIRAARLAPFGTVRMALAGRTDSHLQLELRATGLELEPDTDTSLVEAGYVAVTALTGITRAGGEDEVVSLVAAGVRARLGGEASVR
ncbi:MAG: 5/3-nucleotidase [Actinomycetota bacterium]|nr:5/3-nucleotidase [Actinomycetota bacterium]